jgi:hypothetical protein
MGTDPPQVVRDSVPGINRARDRMAEPSSTEVALMVGRLTPHVGDSILHEGLEENHEKRSVVRPRGEPHLLSITGDIFA